jgi:hypothetical protein
LIVATKSRPRQTLQPDAPPGIDRRTRTRLADPVDQDLAARALEQLATQHNRIALVPAPRPSFDGHKIRVQEDRNPKWYREFVRGRWDRRGCQVRRSRVERALVRVVRGKVRGNGFERELLPLLKEVL